MYYEITGDALCQYFSEITGYINILSLSSNRSIKWLTLNIEGNSSALKFSSYQKMMYWELRLKCLATILLPQDWKHLYFKAKHATCTYINMGRITSIWDRQSHCSYRGSYVFISSNKQSCGLFLLWSFISLSKENHWLKFHHYPP